MTPARNHRALGLALTSALLLAGGCARAPGPATDPNLRLAEIVGAWRDQRAAGVACQDGFEPNRPVVDCRRLMKALDTLALEFPRHPGVLFAAASMAREEGTPEKAQSYLTALFAVRPMHPTAAVLRAQIAMEQGNLPFADRTLRDQILLAPDHPGLRETHASVAYLQNDWDAAQKRLRAAERLGAPDWRVAYHRGLIAEAQGRMDDARVHYLRSLDASPGFERARMRLAGIEARRIPE